MDTRCASGSLSQRSCSENFRKQEPIQLQGSDWSEGYVHSRSECVITGADVR